MPKFKYKKQILELIALVDQYGYWSQEVLNYNTALELHKRQYVNNIIHGYEKGRIKKEDII